MRVRLRPFSPSECADFSSPLVFVFRSNPLCPTFFSFSLSVGVAHQQKVSRPCAHCFSRSLPNRRSCCSPSGRSAADRRPPVCLLRVASPSPPLCRRFIRSVVISSSSCTLHSAAPQTIGIARVIPEPYDPSSGDSNIDSNRRLNPPAAAAPNLLIRPCASASF